VAFAGGALLPEGGRLSLVDLDGTIRWKHEIADGVWGHPVILGGDRAVCADLLDSLHFVDAKGMARGPSSSPRRQTPTLFRMSRGPFLLHWHLAL
jgi:hypothetical protein